MHHDIHVLKQVTCHTFKPANMSGFFLCITATSLYKALAMDPLELDADEIVNSQLDIESDEENANNSDMETAEDTKEDSKTGIY